jgi:chorismate mutase/prephenate dehydratase
MSATTKRGGRTARGTLPTLAAIDRQIAQLLTIRAKRAAHDAGGCTAAVPADAVNAVLHTVAAATQAAVAPVRIAYFGQPTTFSHQAAIVHFGHGNDYTPFETISDVFRAVSKGTAQFGVVPIENSNEGAVTHTLDMFIDADVVICAEVLLDIHHHLMSRQALREIRTVYSHPMGLAQCRRWLSTHLGWARCIETYSTAHAAEKAACTRGAAAIAGELAAQACELKILARCIEDYTQNVTRFLVIGRAPAGRTRTDKTSLLFSIKDRPGALYHALKPFKDAGVNMTKIESRPSRLKAWEYYFFADILGHADDADVKQALDRLRRQCNFVKVLGSYPAARRRGSTAA